MGFDYVFITIFLLLLSSVPSNPHKTPYMAGYTEDVNNIL